MLQHPLNKALIDLGLRGMARALERSQRDPKVEQLGFEDRLGLLLDVEQTERQNIRYAKRIRAAKLAQPACTEDLDHSTARGLDARLLSQLITLNWIDQRLNVLIIGPTGVGKSYLACALAHAACKADYLVRYIRLPRLLEELAVSEATRRKSALFKAYAKIKLLVIDDLGLTPLTDGQSRDLLEIIEDRYDKQSTLITSQLPIEHWHQHFGDPTLADAILDRLIHNAHRITLKGESMRRKKALAGASNPTGETKKQT
jgi:DNA replication protein DnaC